MTPVRRVHVTCFNITGSDREDDYVASEESPCDLMIYHHRQ